MVFNVRRPFHRTDTSDAIAVPVEGSDPSSSKDNVDISDEKAPIGSGVKVSGAEIENELTEFRALHQWDPNLPEAVQDQVNNALKSHDLEQEIALDHELNQEDSIYPEGKLTYALFFYILI